MIYEDFWKNRNPEIPHLPCGKVGGGTYASVGLNERGEMKRDIHIVKIFTAGLITTD